MIGHACETQSKPVCEVFPFVTSSPFGVEIQHHGVRAPHVSAAPRQKRVRCSRLRGFIWSLPEDLGRPPPARDPPDLHVYRESDHLVVLQDLRILSRLDLAAPEPKGGGHS